jgi:hypothetical protein
MTEPIDQLKAERKALKQKLKKKWLYSCTRSDIEKEIREIEYAIAMCK